MITNIGKPVTTHTPPTKCYTVEIETMMGDSAGYNTITIGPIKHTDLNELENLIETLNRMKEEGPSNDDGYDNYKTILGFPQWFGTAKTMDQLIKDYPQNCERHSEQENQKIFNNCSGKYSTQWRNDPIADFEIPEIYEKHTVSNTMLK